MKDLSDKELDELEKKCLDIPSTADIETKILWSKILKMITEIRRWREQELYDALASGDIDIIEPEEN